MPTPEQILKEVEDQLAIGRGVEPQAKLADLIGQMGQSALSDWRADLLKIIEKFQPKRRKELLALLDRKTHGRPAAVRESVRLAYTAVSDTASAVVDGEDDLRDDLATLAEKHIFQWSTRYRACLTRHFDHYLAQLARNSTADHYAASLQRLLRDHARDIFSRGYGHQREQIGQSRSTAMQKSVGGLVRFLDLPLEYYFARSSDAVDRDSVLALRRLLSSCALGILDGYQSVSFDDDTGAAVLPRHFSNFAYYLAFLEPDPATTIINVIASDTERDQGLQVIVPLLESLDHLIHKEHEDYYPLPIFGRYLGSQRQLEIGVRAPHSVTSRHVEARAYLSSEFVSPHALDDALASRVALVVAPVRPDIAAHVSSNRRLQDIIVEADHEDVVQEAVHAWDRAIYELRSKRMSGTPYNIAREFPLHQPDQAKFYHVHRTSVRDLLRTFDRKNGVRLWCSVRRSGKTTACFDLDFTSGDSAIVPQTCGTEPSPGGRLFFDSICGVADEQKAIAGDFVMSIVRDCAPASVEDGQRIVFVVDEYETLFGYLQAIVNKSRLFRYTIVQPLLNQLVEFARDNLLVFLGQQPGAHFILMDQNQLAPYVEQDAFPLFEHISGTRAGEFGMLVSKILSDRIDISPGFLDALHRETAGHPFLTVNVLCVFVDWLIERERSLRGLRLRKRDFEHFEKQKLLLDQMMLHHDYALFREAAKEAMSEDGYDSNPWLYAVYWALREMSTAGELKFSVSRADFAEIMDRIPAPGRLPEANEVLRTASQANFLQVTGDQVSVKIRTLGRLAASVRPAQT